MPPSYMKKPKKRYRMTSVQVIALGFLGMILIGALLLMLPFATAHGGSTDFVTALFTSTTSICVTGLVVVDTFSYWSLFGKVVILLLIQMGGFGVITLYSMAILAMHRHVSLRTRTLIQDYYNLESIRGLLVFLRRVVRGTFTVEAIGAVFYAVRFIPMFGIIKGIWISVFTAISAFCNAGIDLLGNNSLIDYSGDLYMNLVTIALIVIGGIGYVVWFDIMENYRKTRRKQLSWSGFVHRLNEHSKLVLNLTFALLISGTVLVFLFEHDNPETMGNMPLGEKWLASLFQSVTFRTAGFATVPQEGLTTQTCIIGYFFMFIGGSPVGSAGGVKTVTVFILFLNAVSFIRSRDETVVFSRRISHEMINKASAVIVVSLTVTVICILMLMQTNKGISGESAAYEIFSATATVGLTRGLTPNLNTAGKLIDIAAMYLGRIGPISMALFFQVGKSEKNYVNFADGHFIVG